MISSSDTAVIGIRALPSRADDVNVVKLSTDPEDLWRQVTITDLASYYQQDVELMSPGVTRLL